MSFEIVDIPKIKVKAGDLVICSGMGNSKDTTLIKFGTQSKYTHVGIILIRNNKIYILHSYVFKNEKILKNYFTGKKKRQGVMLNLFSEFVKNYKGEIWIRPLNKPFDIYNIGVKFKNKDFETNRWEMYNSVIGIGKYFIGSSTKEFFCSEFIAEMFLSMNWLPKGGKTSQFYFPKHFVTKDIGDGKNYWYLNKLIRCI